MYVSNGPEWMDEHEIGAEERAEVEMSSESDVNSVSTEMDAFERDLSAALRPLDLPSGFADRVIAEVERDAKPARAAKVLPFGVRVQQSFRTWRVVAGGAIAASVLAGTFVADGIHQRRERERAEMADAAA